MPYEALSRALAYASCLSTMSLFATTMAMAAVNVAKIKQPGNCGPVACVTLAQKPSLKPLGAERSEAHLEAVAAKLWYKKI